MSHVELVDFDQTEVAEIRFDPITGARSLFSKKSFKANELIINFFAKNVQATPTYLTVQVSENKHIELFPDCLECINHSCDPNCFFDTAKMELVTLKPIQAGEEFVFFYPSAEWDMDQQFKCHCGSNQCIGDIRGAKYLSAETIEKHRFTDFIKSKLNS